MDNEAIRLRIRDRLADGALPHDHIPRVWGGKGNNEICMACDLPIRTADFVMEGIGEEMKAVQFHVECFYLWGEERDAPGRS